MTSKKSDELIVLPGDKISLPSYKNLSTILGPGLCKVGDDVIATIAGTLEQKGKNTFYVSGHQQRYVPAKGDCVIGIIAQRGMETLRVNIGGSELASMSLFAFEGATKRNRPNVNVGDVLFAQVIQAHKGMEPEIACVDSYGHKATFGILESNASFLTNVPVEFCHRLLMRECKLIGLIGLKLKYEIVVGHNGRIWINSSKLSDTHLIHHVIDSAKDMNLVEINHMCNLLLSNRK